MKSSGVRGLWKDPRNSMVNRAFIIIIFIYSALKKRAKGPVVYSKLKPETSSASPPVRSNGAQLVSASVEINHIMASGHVGIRIHRGS